MKKIILNAAFALLFAGAAQAQVGTGLFAGGGLGISMGSSKTQTGSTTTNGPKTTSFNVMPRVGYFFTDNIGAGLVFGYGSSSTKTEGVIDTKTSMNTLSVGLFGRYALGFGEESNFFFTGDLNLGFSSITGKTEAGSVSVKADPTSVISVGIAPGILFFPTPKIGLEAGLGNIVSFDVSTTTDANNSDNKSSQTNINILNLSTLGFNFGLNYYFSR